MYTDNLNYVNRKILVGFLDDIFFQIWTIIILRQIKKLEFECFVGSDNNLKVTGMLKLVHILAVSDAEVNKIFLKRQLQRSVILQYYNITAPRVFNP